MSTHVDEVEQAVAGLFTAYRRLRGREQQRADDLSGAQLRALDSLADVGHATAKHLADFADVTPATMTGMLDSLEAKGIIRRERGTTDRRTVQVVLTKKGHEVVEAARKRWRERWGAALGDLPTQDLQATTRALTAVRRMFDEM
jgi:DNA-binding MarR family transcriptional regulator